MLTTVQDSLRTLIIPMRGRNLLLPNVAVAEVVPYIRPRAVADAPDWLLGVINWRGLNIPLVSYDGLYGTGSHEGVGQARIAVINTVTPDSDMPFYALVTTGIPQLKRVNADLLQEQSAEAAEGVLSQVHVGDVPAVIPDLAALEAAVANCWKRVA
jgi:chemosensory pili system protein ChpC